MKEYKGYLIVVLACLTTTGLWILSKSDLGSVVASPFIAIGQLLALLGLVLMAANLFFATKSRLIEKYVSGLDKMYIIHRLTGSFAFVFLLQHPLFFVLSVLPNKVLAYRYLLPGADISYNLGIFAEYLLVLTFIFIVVIKLPYHLWKIAHKLTGIVFILGVLHALSIGSDIAVYLPLKIWIYLVAVVGLLSYIYTTLFYRKLGPRYDYLLAKIEVLSDVVNLYLKPIMRQLHFDAGQFCYIDVESDLTGRELHPFTISSGQIDGLVRVSAKKSGDYTHKLEHLSLGSKVNIYGPYGTFLSDIPDVDGKVVLVAGGIGITPFLSLVQRNILNAKYSKLSLIYSVKNLGDAIFTDELNLHIKKMKDSHLQVWATSDKGRITCSDLSTINNGLDRTKYYFCGPKLMMESLTKQLTSLGVRRDDISFEDFSFL